MSVFLLVLCITTSGLQGAQDFFESTWPFQDNLTDYDGVYKKLVRKLYFQPNPDYQNLYNKILLYIDAKLEAGTPPSLQIPFVNTMMQVILPTKSQQSLELQAACELARLKIFFPEWAELLTSFTLEELKKTKLLFTYTFTSNLDKNYWEQVTNSPIGFVYYHGLGDNKNNFKDLFTLFENPPAHIGVDFNDHDPKKPIALGSQIDLQIAAHCYWIAQLTKPEHIKRIILFGLSRGGGVVAALLEKIKPEFKPDRAIIISPLLHAIQTLEHLQDAEVNFRFPATSVTARMSSAQFLKKKLIDIHAHVPQLRDLQIPILAIHGENDELIPHQQTQEWIKKATNTTSLYYDCIKKANHYSVVRRGFSVIEAFAMSDTPDTVLALIRVK